VNILTEDQQELSARFAAWPEGRFEGLNWTHGASGAPILADVLGVLECRVHNAVEVGDHTVLFGEVERAQCQEARPLLYFSGAYARLRPE
jgi:flavin reductase (DIM6/NTAB) family NADH-FMN oxidoreductase RutF